jgi:hypothetical protein
MRRTSGLIGSASLAVALAASVAAPAAAATPPGNFERHEGAHWTWYAPPRWVAAEGANDIYISSPTGVQYLHYGAGGTPCYEPSAFFSAARASYRSSHAAFGLYSKPLASARYTKVGPIRTIGQSYYRQTSRFQGRRRNGAQIRGELVLDIFAVEPLSGVCGERQQVRSAPSRGLARALRLLRLVQSLIFGPR